MAQTMYAHMNKWTKKRQNQNQISSFIIWWNKIPTMAQWTGGDGCKDLWGCLYNAKTVEIFQDDFGKIKVM
jgi:hypothetical protein